eukprot:GHVR01062820.1.p1 GENE.GHVR01062820.1~~GHVR01062820.1.p1  ORF type:complete len:118 (+),score=6.18 GHVR01062820.1:2099-2452(+)
MMMAKDHHSRFAITKKGVSTSQKDKVNIIEKAVEKQEKLTNTIIITKIHLIDPNTIPMIETIGTTKRIKIKIIGAIKLNETKKGMRRSSTLKVDVTTEKGIKIGSTRVKVEVIQYKK